MQEAVNAVALMNLSRCIAIVTAGVAALAAAVLPCAAMAQSVALVTDRTGVVSTVQPGRTSVVAVLAELPVGARLQLQANSSLTLLYLQSGDEYTLTGPGECELKAAGPVFDAAKMRRRTTEIASPVKIRVDNVTLGGVVMRSATPRPLFPVGLVLEHPDQLAWNSLLSEARFLVELRVASGPLLLEQPVVGLGLPLPPDLQLEAGKQYAWSVRLADSDDGTPATLAAFEMASDEMRTQALRRRPPPTATFGERVLYALWLEQVGAVGEARQWWATLAKERPDEAAMLARSRR